MKITSLSYYSSTTISMTTITQKPNNLNTVANMITSFNTPAPPC